MTKLIFLGSGSAFTVGADNFQSNMILISDRGNKLLIDCGSDIRFSLHAAGFSHLDVTDIYISHLHADHIGGLEYIGFSTKFDPRCNKPRLYLSQELVGDLWSRSLSGGMRSIEGDIADLDTYFDVRAVPINGFFEWDGIQFTLIRTIHVMNGYFIFPSYGLFFELDGFKVLLTTDTKLCMETFGQYYEEADIIFQDCETAKFPSQIHAHYHELVKLPKGIRHKMWLYHYQPGYLPNCRQDGFQGFVKRGQTFAASDVAALTEIKG
ncbi:MBL fold metallo-hydrolase [Limnofasciculus baicalensis]|uniref:MBL fold metallo-hydrolase n=1 Tax=Limnofasciculus baicalensis BBK-W-15 TaxID=2699891 RepID=A0AAE3GSR8_9CYAN|nr:MBL fold metallo-hydrolase [Limnofasciculus baicalensis]MCP2729594.1 MBL fold metallo-hydrolase [Limnofasciculus baicalensis BBK-W-15]